MKKKLLAYPRMLKQSIVIAADVVSILLSVWIVFSVRFHEWHVPEGEQWFPYLLAPVLAIPVFIRFGLYRAVFRYNGFDALTAIFKATVVYGVLFYAILWLFRFPSIPVRSIGGLQPMLLLLAVGWSRIFVRIWFSGHESSPGTGANAERVLVYGAGAAGIEIARAILASPKFMLVGFIDDNPGFHGRMINGNRVYAPGDARMLAEEGDVSGILLAIPSASRRRRAEIVDQFKTCPVHIKTLPGLEALADGRVSISDIRDVEIEDLLGRDPLPIDGPLFAGAISGRVVMVTGAGGSIGGELARQVLIAAPSVLLLLDNAEYGLYAIHRELEQAVLKSGASTRLVPLLADVADERRMQSLCLKHAPDVIYHAAAYKHVPMIEGNPLEGVRNNVFGTLAVATAALAARVSSVVLVSTDKAVRPTNVMGASKRVCELVLQGLAAEDGHQTCFSMVRFGNVLGSSGSVVPLFREQIVKGGPVTLTHEDITRYFMTIPEAAQLVIQAGAMARGGEVFLLDMGEPVKIMELARRMIELSGLSVRDGVNPDGDIAIAVTGLRPGEKLYEELLIGGDPAPTHNPRIFKTAEQFMPWGELQAALGTLSDAVAEDDVQECSRIIRMLVPEYSSVRL